MKRSGCRMVAVVLLVGLAGCATLKKVGEVIVGPTAPFTGELCVEAPSPTPSRCTTLGEIPVPAEGEAFARLLVAAAGPFLAKTYDAKHCLFTSYPQSTTAGIEVTGTATCAVQGVPFERTVRLTLTPVPPSPPVGEGGKG